MRRFACDMLSAFVSKTDSIDASEEVLTAPEQHRCNREMKLVDQPCSEIFANGGNAPTDADVSAARSCLRTLQCRANTISYKMKGCSTIHRNGRASMMCQHEHGHVIGRVRTPPSLPLIVSPRPTRRPKHVAAHDPSAEILHAARREIIVHTSAGSARVCSDVAVRPLKRRRADEPLMQSLAAYAERRLQRLIEPRTVTIDRNRKRIHTKLRHDWRSLAAAPTRSAFERRRIRQGEIDKAGTMTPILTPAGPASGLRAP